MAAPAERLAGAGAAPAWLAAAAVLAMALAMLAVTAGPLATDDLWFHLGAGRAYTAEGPWPARDPLLHTALPSAPVQHEWLFGAGVYAVERAFGLHGLRALHGLAFLGLAAAVLALFRRAAPGSPFAWLAGGVFLALAWWRLAQLRPDLASLAATLAACALVLRGPGVPAWRRVAGFAALCALWANVHSLFAVGLALGVAVLLGIALEALLARALGLAMDPARGARARRVAAAVGLGALAALANPRGAAQHLTFLRSSRDSAIWSIRDEWIHFQPLSWRAGGYAEDALAWALTNLLIAAFLLAAARRAWRLWRAPSAERLRGVDAEGFGLGLAALVAIAVSIRFRWLAFLPLVYLLRDARALRAPAAGFAAAAAALLLAGAFVFGGPLGRFASLLPRAPGEWLARSHVAGKYHAESVRFLAEAGVRGNLFNHYWMGGFLGFWLAPGLRTFVDGRTEHYAPDVLHDASEISRRAAAGAETWLQILDRRRVDVYLGLGEPPMGVGPWLGVYTAAHFEGVPGWVPAFRAVDQAVWLRRAGGDENLARVARWWAGAGAPFDPARGFEPDRVIREAPEVAREIRLLPRDHAELVRAAAAGGPDAVAAGETLALGYAAAGAYTSAEAAARAVLARDGLSRPARRALVYALLRTHRSGEAQTEARALRRLDASERAERVASVAATLARRSDLPDGGAGVLLGFPLLDEAETSALLAHYDSISLLRRAPDGRIAAFPAGVSGDVPGETE